MRLNIPIVLTICLAFSLTACDSSSHNHDHSSSDHSHEKTKNDTVAQANIAPSHSNQVDNVIALFDKDSFTSEPKIVDCTLSGGSTAKCLSISIKPKPANMNIGPWCPRNIADGAEKSGIWLESGKVFDADGEFISNLAQFYKDDIWQMFNQQTGDINVTDSKVSCEAAARPDVDEKYQNHCVECQVSYMDDDASRTFVIPLSPVKSENASSNTKSGVGIAFSGVTIDSSAPTHAILAAHTLAPFDDCGGHVNLHAGYHLHAITDKPECLKEVSNDDDHAPAVGLALDGFTIHKQVTSNDSSLDSCGGHETASHGYHYHAAEPGKNQILACHTGETGCTLDDPNGSCDATQNNKRGGPPRDGNRPPKDGSRPPHR